VESDEAVTDTAYTLLSKGTISFKEAAYLSIYSHLLLLCHRGDREARLFDWEYHDD
jgi:hypothetical protein